MEQVAARHSDFVLDYAKQWEVTAMSRPITAAIIATFLAGSVPAEDSVAVNYSLVGIVIGPDMNVTCTYQAPGHAKVRVRMPLDATRKDVCPPYITRTGVKS